MTIEITVVVDDDIAADIAAAASEMGLTIAQYIEQILEIQARDYRKIRGITEIEFD